MPATATPPKYPIVHKDQHGTFCRATQTHALIDHPGARGGKTDQMKMSEKVAQFIGKVPPSSPVTFTYSVDEWGSKTLTFITTGEKQPETAPINAAAATATEQTQTPKHECNCQQNASVQPTIPVTTLTKERLIVLQSSLKAAGELYTKIHGEEPDANGKAPAIVMEWAIYFSRGIMAEALTPGVN